MRPTRWSRWCLARISCARNWGFRKPNAWPLIRAIHSRSPRTEAQRAQAQRPRSDLRRSAGGYMDLGKYGHLTYSTLVHPGDTWAQMWESLTTFVPRVKKRISPNAPFGVSLRLSASSAETLINSAAERNKLKSFLASNDLYLYTVNAFPYGPFKNTIVKEQVYEPDWRSQKRAKYTENVAEILAGVAPSFVNPSIQSPPLGFKPRVTGDDVVQAYAANIRQLAAFLHRLRERTGRTVTLAVEPEPYCYLETTAETVQFFTQVLRADSSIQALAST